MQERLSCCTKLATPDSYSPNDGVTCLEFKCEHIGKMIRIYYTTEEGIPEELLRRFMARLLPLCAQCTAWKDLSHNADNA